MDDLKARIAELEAALDYMIRVVDVDRKRMRWPGPVQLMVRKGSPIGSEEEARAARAESRKPTPLQ